MADATQRVNSPGAVPLDSQPPAFLAINPGPGLVDCGLVIFNRKLMFVLGLEEAIQIR